MYRNYVDISVAVSSPNGLVVPVLRNVEDMGECQGGHHQQHLAILRLAVTGRSHLTDLPALCDDRI